MAQRPHEAGVVYGEGMAGSRLLGGVLGCGDHCEEADQAYRPRRHYGHRPLREHHNHGRYFTGSSGTRAAIAEGSMTTASSHFGLEIMNNDAAGILSAKATFDRVEFTNNTLDSRALGVIGAAMKARNEVEVKQSYIHGTQGNGLWCDYFCEDSPTATYPIGFWVHDNLVVDSGRASIRFKRVGDVSTAGEALMEDNEVRGNSPNEKRGGNSVRDAQIATYRTTALAR